MDKTNAVIFSRKTKVKDMYGFYHKHNNVPLTDQYKYLRLVFTSNRKLKFASEQFSEKGI